MMRKRLTREESRGQTRQRLLDAAAQVIARKGWADATVDDIAAAAGYSRGAFYSNFKGRDDLFIELCRIDHCAMHEELASAFGNVTEASEILARVSEFYGQLYRDNAHFLLWTEAKLHAVRNKPFRARLNALLREDRQMITGFIAEFFARTGFTSALDAKELAVGSMALVDGIKFLHLTDPGEVPDQTARRVLIGFFTALFGPAANSKP
jgi:AcrR family transcriptional regulator